MEEENKYGKTSLSIKGIGKIIKPMEEDVLSTLMVMFTKESGKMTKPMVKVFTITTMDQATMDNGMRIFRKVLEYKNGLMDHHIKGILFIY